MRLLEQIDSVIAPSQGIPPSMNVRYDKNVYKRLVSFVTTLKPDQLSQEQNDRLADLITRFDFMIGQEEDE